MGNDITSDQPFVSLRRETRKQQAMWALQGSSCAELEAFADCFELEDFSGIVCNVDEEDSRCYADQG